MYSVHVLVKGTMWGVYETDTLDKAFEIAHLIMCKNFKLGLLHAVRIYQNDWLCYEFVSHSRLD